MKQNLYVWDINGFSSASPAGQLKNFIEDKIESEDWNIISVIPTVYGKSNYHLDAESIVQALIIYSK